MYYIIPIISDKLHLRKKLITNVTSHNTLILSLISQEILLEDLLHVFIFIKFH